MMALLRQFFWKMISVEWILFFVKFSVVVSRRAEQQIPSRLRSAGKTWKMLRQHKDHEKCTRLAVLRGESQIFGHCHRGGWRRSFSGFATCQCEYFLWFYRGWKDKAIFGLEFVFKIFTIIKMYLKWWTFSWRVKIWKEKLSLCKMKNFFDL